MKNFSQKIEDQVISDVREVLAEIDIEAQIEYYLDPKRIKEAVKRGLDDIVTREVGDKMMLSVRKAIMKKMEVIDPIIEHRVMEIIADEFKL